MMSSNCIVVRRVAVTLVALFAFFLGSLQAAFAEEALENNAETIGTADAALDDRDSAETIANDADQDLPSVDHDVTVLLAAHETDAESEAVADDGEQKSNSGIISDSSILESGDWMVIPEDRVGARVGTEIAVSVAMTTLVFTGAAFLIADVACVPSEEDCSASSSDIGKSITVGILGAIGIYAPTFAVHISHAIFGGEGSIGWTYLGGLIGAGVGVGLGAISFPFGYGLFVMPVLGFAGCLVGAILGYELTNSRNREQKYGTISRIYPVLEFGPERNVVGVGFEF